MKIYETLLKVTNVIDLPGIYYFRNKINNKYYIGQAMSIKHRFKGHCHNIKINNDKYPIYKAINEFGEENFEFAIIGVIRNTTQSKNKIRTILDKYEKEFIKKYDSYKNGYNQTLGGDGGILGYKMTEEQKQHISENSKKIANDGRNTIYVYNLEEEKEYSFTSCQAAADFFSIKRDAMYAALRRNGSCNHKFILSRNKESLLELVTFYKEKIKNSKNNNKITWNSGMYENKYTIEEYIKIKNENPLLSATQLSELMGVCKKTIYNYEKQLPNPTFKQKEETKYKIINIQTLEENIVNAKEGGKLFNLSDGQFRKTEKYCRDHSSIYKKKYKIIRLNNI